MKSSLRVLCRLIFHRQEWTTLLRVLVVRSTINPGGNQIKQFTRSNSQSQQKILLDLARVVHFCPLGLPNPKGRRSSQSVPPKGIRQRKAQRDALN
ncbi:MAG: hypothetical protein KME49_33105 [Brasilonema octagenarum HA4186-MV1]|uniref:hypothetical protein n=1 Tax=Brasilonema octagenarum TaxID=417105 RepID=UPI00145D98EB|nr:hypothetical protein [Brasilonema octagenarum]MBW4630221.1 hypothetical protein [Brasilonema octagenarum HA4186-MV1]